MFFIFLTLSVFFIFLYYLIKIISWNFTSAIGKVCSNEQDEFSLHHSYYAVIAYVVNEKKYFKRRFWSRPFPIKDGTMFKVFYNPKNPSQVLFRRDFFVIIFFLLVTFLGATPFLGINLLNIILKA